MKGAYTSNARVFADQCYNKPIAFFLGEGAENLKYFDERVIPRLIRPKYWL